MQSLIATKFRRLEPKRQCNQTDDQLPDNNRDPDKNVPAFDYTTSNGYLKRTHMSNGAPKKTLSFVRKIVKARDAPFPPSDVDPDYLTSDEVVVECRPDIFRPQIIITVDGEVDHRKLVAKSLEGIEARDPLAIDTAEETKNSSNANSISDMCGELYHSTEEFPCLRFECSDSESKDELSTDSSSAEFIFCDTCGEFYPSSQEKHCERNPIELTSSVKPTRNICEYCNLVFDGEEQFAEHMYQHSDQPFICDRCGTLFTSQEELSDHEMQHGDTVTCTQCETVCDDAIALELHTRTRPVPIECEQCNVTFESYCQLQLHLAVCKKTKQCSCKVCGQTFACEARLVMHSRLHQQPGRPYGCDYCFVRYLKRDHLIRHQRANMNYKDGVQVKYECTKCYLKFDTKCGFRRHQSIQHEESLHDTVQIKDDGSRLSDSKLLRTRLLNQKDDVVDEVVEIKKSNRCEECGQSFESHSGLLRHQAKHENIQRQFRCKHCPKSFTHQPSLSKHIRLNHMQGGTFECPLCDRYFAENVQLERHLRWHKCANFKCFTCGILYSCSKNLHRHLKKFKNHRGSTEFNTTFTKEDPVPDVSFKVEKCMPRIVSIRSGNPNSSVELTSIQPKDSADSSISTSVKLHDSADSAKLASIKSDDSVDSAKLTSIKSDDSVESSEFMTYAQLMQHFAGKDKPFVCPICGKPWSARIHCVEHYLTHSKERPFKCDLCQQGFIRKKQLRKHIYCYHSDENSESDDTEEEQPQQQEEFQHIKWENRPEFDATKLLSRYSHLNLITPTIRIDRLSFQKYRAQFTDSKQQTASNIAYYCDKCGKLYEKKSSIVSHRLMCGISRIQSDVPKARKSTPFKHMSTYEDGSRVIIYGIEHTRSKERGVERYICGMCKRVFDKRNVLFKHTLVHIANKPFKCILCPSRGFMTRKSMRKHFRNTHKGIPVPPLNSVSSEETSCRRQSTDVEEDEEDCKSEIIDDQPVAGSPNGSKSPEQITVECDLNEMMDMYEPENTVTKEENYYSQDYAAQDAYTNQEAADINEQATTNVQIPYDYNLLDYQLPEMNLLMNHFLESTSYEASAPSDPHTYTIEDEKEVLDEEPFEINLTCAQCNTPFENRDVLFLHYTVHDQKNDPMKCFICSKEFVKRQYLQIHAMMHRRAKLYQCSYCKKPFRNNRDMNDHVRMHTGEKPFKCYTCHRRFRTKKQLQIHDRMHTGDQPYQCTICKSRFNIYKSLKRHLKSSLSCTAIRKSDKLNPSTESEVSRQLENLISSQLSKTDSYPRDDILFNNEPLIILDDD